MSMLTDVVDRSAPAPLPSPDGARLQTLTPPRAAEWSQLGVDRKLRYLERLRDDTERLCEAWAAIGNELRQIPDSDSATDGLSATGWLCGPTFLAASLAGYLQSYRSCAVRGSLPALRSRRRPHTGRQTLEAFPRNLWDSFAWPSLRGEIWLGADGSYERRSPLVARSLGVALVFCAGNFEAPVDVLYQLFGLGHAVVLAPSPVNAAIVPIYEDLFASLIDGGYLRIAPSDLETKRSLLGSAAVDEVMLTGSVLTYNRIVWGSDTPGAGPRRLTKPITAELGDTSPYIIVPGCWSSSDVAHHARQLAAAKLWNAGHSCGSPQILVTSRHWKQRQQFLEQLQRQLSILPKPPSYFAGADARCAMLARDERNARPVPASSPRASATWLIPDAGRASNTFRQEAFGPLLAEACLDAADPVAFLEEATAFCNDQLTGCLSATLVIDSQTRAMAEAAFERALDRLEYGALGVNVFGLLVNAIPQLGWGAHARGSSKDMRSGCGRLAGTDLIHGEEKSVLLSPFRALAHFQPLERKMKRVAPALMRQSLRPGFRRCFDLLRAAVG